MRSTYLKASWQQPRRPDGLAHQRLGELERHVLRGAAGRGRDRESMMQRGRDRVPGVASVLTSAQWLPPGPSAAGAWPGGWSYIPQPGVIG